MKQQEWKKKEKKTKKEETHNNALQTEQREWMTIIKQRGERYDRRMSSKKELNSKKKRQLYKWISEERKRKKKRSKLNAMMTLMAVKELREWRIEHETTAHEFEENVTHDVVPQGFSDEAGGIN